LSLRQEGPRSPARFRLALVELRSALDELAELQGSVRSRIVVGAMPLSRARVIPEGIIAFQRHDPDVNVSIVEGSYAELIGPLRDGDLDLMIGALRDPIAGSDLVQIPLFIDRPRIMARSGHPLCGRLASDDLAGFPWIVPPEGTPLRQLWTEMFDALGTAPPRVPIECGSVMTIRQLLRQGDFLTLLSADQVLPEIDADWIVDIGPPPIAMSRTIGIVTRADWRPTKVKERFIAALSSIVDATPS
jgi:LysR family transcriptional regulator of gallate degradation